MKKQYLLLVGIIFSFLFTSTVIIKAEDNQPTIVYFYSPACGDCQETKPYIDHLKEDGINVIDIDVTYKNESQKRMSYQVIYEVTSKKYNSGPLVFAGDKAFSGTEDIVAAINSGELQAAAANPLLDVPEDAYKDFPNFDKYLGISGFFMFLGVGLLDGINPCAIAMLLMFISLLFGVSNNKKLLIGISISYILGLFLTYFALGAFLMNFLHNVNLKPLMLFINILILGIAVILFVLNLYDFIVSKNEEFGKVKNQLPKPIQKLNKKLITFFTNSLNNKNIFMVYLLTFTLGVIISMTEFLCTGQVYLPTILILDEVFNSYLFKIYALLVYNVAFVMPLIIITIIAVVSSSVMGLLDFFRRHLSLIKLFNALFFLGIIIYFVRRIFF